MATTFWMYFRWGGAFSPPPPGITGRDPPPQRKYMQEVAQNPADMAMSIIEASKRADRGLRRSTVFHLETAGVRSVQGIKRLVHLS